MMCDGKHLQTSLKRGKKLNELHITFNDIHGFLMIFIFLFLFFSPAYLPKF